MKIFILYMLRWQLSTPILFLVLYFVEIDSQLIQSIIANFVGSIIFFWVDQYLFTNKKGDDKTMGKCGKKKGCK